MAKCENCMGDAVFGKPISSGIICKSCYNSLPKVIRPFIEGYTAHDISIATHMCSDSDKFDSTAAYGNLQIDELNGLFAVDYKGELCVFNSLELDQVGIYCTNPSADRNNSVYCDVEFSCKFQRSNISFKITLKNHVNCRSHKKDGTHLEWEEPGDLSLFRNMFMQMYDSARNKYNRNVTNNLVSKQDIDFLKAEALFMIDGEYSDAEIEEKREKLLSVFTREEEIKKINYAYSILLTD